MGFIDITVDIFDGMVHYPSDPSVEVTSLKSIANGDSSNLSRLSFGSHTGTHLDAPRHFMKDGLSVDEILPGTLVGPCQVVEFGGAGHIDSSFCEQAVNPKVKRVLFKTSNSWHWDELDYFSGHTALQRDGARWLCGHDIILVGIDYLSIEANDATEPVVHRRLLGSGCVILEGLDLRHVQAGVYELICLPLKLRGLDGAPVRAILREI